MRRLADLLHGKSNETPRLVEKVRYRMVGKYLGGVLMVLGATMLLQSAASFMLGEGAWPVIFYASYAAVAATSGSVLYRRVPEREVTVSEAAVVAAASFLTASLAGAVPFAVLGAMPALDAWFESMSGFTTTGFSLMDVSGAPGSLLLLRAVSQWLGGMGFVVLTVAMLLISGSSAVTFLREERAEQRLFPTIARHVRLIIITYTALTVGGVVLLLAGGLDPLSAICYTLSGVSTGGFAVHNDSMASLSAVGAALPMVFIMLAGATNFVLYYRSWRDGKGLLERAFAMVKDPQFSGLIILTAATGILLGATMGGGAGGFAHGMFLAASAQTTTGFYTTDPAHITGFAQMVIIASMFVGGAAGSTAGGIKLFRLFEIVRGINRFFVMKLYPKESVFPGQGAGRGVASEDLLGIFYVAAIYAATVFVSAAIFVWYGYGPLESLFEVTSAVGTVGLSSGVVTPGLDGGLKVLLTLLMWAGRLEFLPIVIWGYSVAAK